MNHNHFFPLALLVIALLNLSFLFNSQETSDKEFLSKIVVYNSIHHHEKLYLHIDKPVYFTGEDIWFSAYITNARTNKLNRSEKVLYVELIKPNGAIATKQIFKITDGRCSGNLFIKNNLTG